MTFIYSVSKGKIDAVLCLKDLVYVLQTTEEHILKIAQTLNCKTIEIKDETFANFFLKLYEEYRRKDILNSFGIKLKNEEEKCLN